MTLEDVKRKTAILLDEFDNEEIDPNSEYKFADLCDTAQKIIALKQPVIRLYTVTPVSGTRYYPMPNDFERAIRVWRCDKVVERQWIGRNILTTDEVIVEYSAAPATINNDTAETYEMEVSESAAQAIPYYIAGNCLLADLVQSPNNLIALWNQFLADIPKESTRQHRVKRVY